MVVFSTNSAVKLSCTLKRKTALNDTVSISLLDCGDGVHWIILSISFPSNTTGQVGAKELDFSFI